MTRFFDLQTGAQSATQVAAAPGAGKRLYVHVGSLSAGSATSLVILPHSGSPIFGVVAGVAQFGAHHNSLTFNLAENTGLDYTSVGTGGTAIFLEYEIVPLANT